VTKKIVWFSYCPVSDFTQSAAVVANLHSVWNIQAYFSGIKSDGNNIAGRNEQQQRFDKELGQ
jgi:hypothetical protein